LEPLPTPEAGVVDGDDEHSQDGFGVHRRAGDDRRVSGQRR
jgi:hypothetical protein